MTHMPIVAVMDGAGTLARCGEVARLAGQPEVSFLIPTDRVAAVASEAGVTLEVSPLPGNRQNVRLALSEGQGLTNAWYEAEDKRVVPIRWRRLGGPDSMGLMWPVFIPFVYAGLWGLWRLSRLAAGLIRR